MNKEAAAKEYMNFLYWPKPQEGQIESDMKSNLTVGQAKSLAENSFKFGWDAALSAQAINEDKAQSSSAMKWVRASEKMPSKETRGKSNPIVRWDQDFGNKIDGKCSYLLYETLEYFVEHPEKFFNVEWLDEQSPINGVEEPNR